MVAFAIAENNTGPRPTTFPARLTEVDLPIAPISTGKPPPKLTSMHSLENVNQLVAKQRIDFGPNMTVIYGANGAGKSGYARVLKKTCRCNEQAVESILKNVYQATTGAITAKFEISGLKTTETISWTDGIPLDERLRYFAIFDSKAARQFISEQNEIPSPTVFTKLELLGDIIKRVKDRLAKMSNDTMPSAETLKSLVDETTTGKLIAQISAQTQQHALESALAWVVSDEKRLADTEAQLSTLKLNGPLALKKQLQQRLARIRVLRTEMEKIETALSQVKITKIKSLIISCKQLKSAKDIVAQHALGLSILPGTGTDIWENLLKVAADYYAQHIEKEHAPFPGKPKETRCVLCQQALDDNAFSRLTGFWQFLQDTASVRLDESLTNLSDLTSGLKLITQEPPSNINAIAAQLEDDLPEIWPDVQGFFKQHGMVAGAIIAALKADDLPVLPALPVSLLAKCDAFIKNIIEQEEKLGDPAQANATLVQMSSTIKELNSKKRAAGRKSEILEYQRKLHSASYLRTLSDTISTRTVSNKVSSLQKKYVTDAFSNTLQTESKALGLKRAIPGLTPRTEKGRTTHAITIAGAVQTNATPEFVFSEGERTALALAYFLVDIGTPIETPCAIFDDPVNSLDHRIRTKVVERLCALSRDRQVVIFTHDLPFYCELRETATRENIPLSVQSVEAIGTQVGFVRKNEPVEAMKVSDRETLLQDILNEARNAEKSGQLDDFAMQAFRFYSRLRSTWERAVEEILFNKVVQRFDKDVKTLQLLGAFIDEDAIKRVFAAMTKCSGLIDGHDHAIARNTDTPDCDEMAKDLAELKKFRSEYVAKGKDQGERLKHLKGKA